MAADAGQKNVANLKCRNVTVSRHHMSYWTRTMIPGYKQVEGFGADEEYEKEEEVEYVTLDLGKDVSKELLQDATEYRLVVSTHEQDIHSLFTYGTGIGYHDAIAAGVEHDIPRYARGAGGHGAAVHRRAR